MHPELICELLLLLILVNGTPVLLSRIMGTRWNLPLDGGRHMRDGHRVLGPAKTLRGIIAALIAGTLAGPLAGLTLLYGLLFAGLSMCGDLLSSFTKRRLGFTTSCSRPLLDQVPECLLPLLLLQPHTSATLTENAMITGLFVVIDLAITALLKPTQPTCR